MSRRQTRSPLAAARVDYAPLIARVLAEHPPATMSTNATITWAQRTWPGCTREETLRAILIADELLDVDWITRDLG